MKRKSVLKKYFLMLFAFSQYFKVYSIIALASYYTKHFKQCSRAFTKLEKLKEISDEERDKIEQIAVSIFLP